MLVNKWMSAIDSVNSVASIADITLYYGGAVLSTPLAPVHVSFRYQTRYTLPVCGPSTLLLYANATRLTGTASKPRKNGP